MTNPVSCIGLIIDSDSLNFMAKKGSASTEKKSADKKGKSKSSASADDSKGKAEVCFHQRSGDSWLILNR